MQLDVLVKCELLQVLRVLVSLTHVIAAVISRAHFDLCPTDHVNQIPAPDGDWGPSYTS